MDYLSRAMSSIAQRYTRIENARLALVFASQKLQHYFLIHAMHLVLHDNLVHYLLQQPALLGRAVTMALKLIKFDIKCIT